jgi:hypothetical protein
VVLVVLSRTSLAWVVLVAVALSALGTVLVVRAGGVLRWAGLALPLAMIAALLGLLATDRLSSSQFGVAMLSVAVVVVAITLLLPRRTTG